MRKKRELRVTAITWRVEDETLLIAATVSNQTQRALFAYVEPRRIAYDDATHRLTLNLHDRSEGPASPHTSIPRLATIQPESEASIEIRVPQILHRIRSAAERSGGQAVTQNISLAAVLEVAVEIAYGDKPLYPRPGSDLAGELGAWGDVATHTQAGMVVE